MVKDVFIVNIHPNNWDPCRDRSIFGLRKGLISPKLEKGDLFFVRVTGKDYGLRGIWSFERSSPVESPKEVPWTDAEYGRILYFNQLIREFKKPFCEEFVGKSKYSEKVKFNSARIMGSIKRLNSDEIYNYLTALMREKPDELNVEASYLDTSINVSELLEKTIKDAKTKREVKIPVGKERIEDLVGDPINFRGIIYSPLNEAGVILLFSKVMKDLGIFYEASPSTGMPDLIARERTKRGLEKRYIEFEYKSSNFKAHKHDIKKCDIIVCWEHDWQDCPLRVIELKEVVEELSS